MKKTCTDCLTEKDLGRFYAHPKGALGVMSVCKVCHKRNVTENRQLKADYYRERERERSNRPERLAARRAYSKTPAGKVAHLRANRVYRRFKAMELSGHDRNEVRQAHSVHRQAVSPDSRMEVTQGYGRRAWADASRSGQDAAGLQIQAGSGR